MAVDFDTVLSAAHGAFASPATWTPSGGDPVSVTLVPTRETEITGFGVTRTHSDTVLFQGQRSQMENPDRGDEIVFDGTEYEIKSKPGILDPEQLIWFIECSPV